MRIGELAGLVASAPGPSGTTTASGCCPSPRVKQTATASTRFRDAVELARVRRLTELGLSLEEVGDALAGDAGRDLVEILRELDADLASQETDLRQRRARLAQMLWQAEAGGKLSEQAPVSAGLAELFDRMARVAAERPGPESAMAAKDRDLMALLETASPARGTGWLDVLTRTLNSDPGAAERAYAVYARLDELAGSPVDDPRVERIPALRPRRHDEQETHTMTSQITSPAANAELVRAGFRAFNAGNAEECLALAAPDLIMNLAELPEPLQGRETWRQGFEMIKHAFPDLQAHIEDIVAAGDQVAVRLRFRGTHSGEFLGIPATGHAIEYVSHEFYRIADGLIAEEWICSDMATLLRQLS